jgi:hypothetical protein
VIRGRALARGFLWFGLASALAAPVRSVRAAEDFEDARKTFRRDSKAAETKTRASAYRALGAYDRPETVEEIVTALAKEESGFVAHGAVKALQWISTPAAVSAVASAARTKTGFVRMCLLLALTDQTGTPQTEALIEVAQGKDAPAAAQAALALGKRKIAAGVPALKALLAGDDPRLRAAAGRAIAAMPGVVDPKDLLPPLADALAASSGRERTDLLAALRAVSGRKLDMDVEAWKKTAAGAALADIVPKPEAPAYFAGIPLYGRRVVIVVDNGIRTEDPHPYQDKERLKVLCQVPNARPVPWFEIRTIRQFAHAHARRAVMDLPKTAAFDLIAVQERAKSAFGKLSPATDGAKKGAEDFLAGLKGDAKHDDFGALTQALDLGGKDAQAWSSGPDEVVYVTCQGPWLAKVSDADEVAAAIGLKARFRMVPIHTVGIGAHPQAFLRTMSDLSGGTYVDLQR